jgi:hypothetical protein
MPATPKKQTTPKNSLVWLRPYVDENEHFRANSVVLNYQAPASDGKPAAKIHVMTVGLSLVPREHVIQAREAAKNPRHRLAKLEAAGRLKWDVDLTKLPEREAVEAVKTTASKTVLKAIIDGEIPAPEAAVEAAVEFRRNWGTEALPKRQRVIGHLGSYTRAAS